MAFEVSLNSSVRFSPGHRWIMYNSIAFYRGIADVVPDDDLGHSLEFNVHKITGRIRKTFGTKYMDN